MKNGKRRSWTTADVRTLKSLARKKTRAGKIAKTLKRTEGATRIDQKSVEGLPNNGRNFLDYTKLTPGVTIVQGPDGDELSINGQKGITNNVSVDGADFKAWLDGKLALEYTLGGTPGPSRSGAAPNPDLLPESNPVLKPPVSGRIGLWAKTDTTSYFKDYVVSMR